MRDECRPDCPDTPHIHRGGIRLIDVPDAPGRHPNPLVATPVATTDKETVMAACCPHPASSHGAGNVCIECLAADGTCACRPSVAARTATNPWPPAMATADELSGPCARCGGPYADHHNADHYFTIGR